ncbi:hypothetical protein L2E82_27664 [Cichorium intybus]|uniref:Uncharacterized protein n=1 Tax=Cichorium intybus TaxID=13427 RepID=A0ACB9CTQ4_CICIN|nr:hypothetical protein L2E82_27664 [Cichorium intybus]
MEQKLPVMAKKVWSLFRVMYSFMLKKGISKTKFFADLNIVIKRGKIAGKALHKLLFHHHHNWASATFTSHPHQLPSGEHQFSCSNTSPNPLSLFSIHKKHQRKHHSIPTPDLASPCLDDIDDICINSELLKALDMLTSVNASPALLGSGKSPMVKQLRITDSPFSVSNGDEDGEVDEAAEKFIMRFYNGLRREN